MSLAGGLRSRPAVSQPAEATIVNALQARLEVRLKELQTAEATIHALRLEQLARDRQISTLKTRIFELEEAALVGNKDATQNKSQPDSSQREGELYDHLVAAAEQERATHLEYIEHLKAQIAQLQR